MEPFFPFIHQISEKEALPLYIELEIPTLEEKIENERIYDDEEIRVIIIDLW